MLDVATRQLNVVQYDHTLSARLAARRFLASVIAWLMSALTWLTTLEDRVHGFRMTSRSTAMAAVESICTYFPATTLGAELVEVVRLLYFDRCLWMTRTAQSQALAHRIHGA
jgi:hypothetical protein